MSVQPVDLNKLRSSHDNLYETVVAISKRAREIHDEERAELEEKLLPYREMIRNPTSESESDKVFPEQIAISLEFESRRKAAQRAIQAFLDKDYDFIVPVAAKAQDGDKHETDRD
ncbi:DNA-directed RNA polymerase subunit omega [Prosthecochloris sp. N3]|uniref:DNA-directed RNA polymerase subunit omega n=1 Tax=Prosthecochloris ethylica TaxID=2743976 RepID=A0ABR9XS36_9CHLB|nr:MULTISPECIES: DNA-directed RNA polymerase subunit omega [Prosthecochloris]MBF0586852.1 DNA-directed RNA polymerase subunit omega [Prosthecochloris ethylica]MBF0636800.1 DNA-directed RNA polymerase subunit omega [Prosthecochloris ethylica]NUK48016.1 DNA-directed RNA polymerase subunit omega [Prosthecochloris ethylica]RNA64308.1 hypothetical protein CR163_003015 [Prosthecochloris sp. ZM_2]